MEQTLLLNMSYEPLKIVGWQRAITLWCQGKAEVVESHEREVRSPNFSMKVPAVIRLLQMVKLRTRPQVQFTRANIYARDNFTCQYCEVRFTPPNLTFDHVVPVAQGGTKSWTNIVAACVPCNRRKANRTPAEAGMLLRHKPRRPLVLTPTTKLRTTWGVTPDCWRSYLYWHTPLETT